MRVFVSGPSGPPEEYDLLREDGYEVVLGRSLPDVLDRPYGADELSAACREHDAFVSSIADAVTRDVLAGAERLRLVTVPFIGVDHIDLEAATEEGILVANSPSEENAVGMAEAAVGLMVALAKRLPHNEELIRAGGWGRRPDRGEMLWGKTVGLLGFGRIARAVATRLAAWGVRIIAHDPYVDEADVELVDLDTLFGDADVLSLHPALTPETAGIVDEQRLRSMKPGAYLLNLARGELVDEGALARALEEGWIAGAALDTFASEPLPADSPLRAVPRDRLILTPHIIGHSEAGRRANLRLCLENVRAALSGRVPDHVLNPTAIDGWRERFDG